MAGFERYLKSKIVRFGERFGEPRRERLRPSLRSGFLNLMDGKGHSPHQEAWEF